MRKYTLKNIHDGQIIFVKLYYIKASTLKEETFAFRE